MNIQDEAYRIFETIWLMPDENKHCGMSRFYSKKLAVLLIKNKYESNRELLFNLKSSGIEISGIVYLSKIQYLIDEERQMIEEIEKI
jgi:hypothetical protein